MKCLNPQAILETCARQFHPTVAAPSFIWYAAWLNKLRAHVQMSLRGFSLTEVRRARPLLVSQGKPTGSTPYTMSSSNFVNRLCQTWVTSGTQLVASNSKQRPKHDGRRFLGSPSCSFSIAKFRTCAARFAKGSRGYCAWALKMESPSGALQERAIRRKSAPWFGQPPAVSTTWFEALLGPRVPFHPFWGGGFPYQHRPLKKRVPLY